MNTEQTTVTRIKDTVINGSMSEAVSILREYQIGHYTERLAAAKGTAEKAFLRRELHNLKNSNNG